MSVKKITNENFEELRREDGTVLLDFYADWCGPCRMLSPIIDEIASERPDLTVGKVNVDDEPELSHEFGIVSIPTVIVMRRGKVVNRLTGARPKAQLLSLLDEEGGV